jgi:hypothetical protein
MKEGNMRDIPGNVSFIGRQGITYSGRPTQMPTLPEGGIVVCEFIRAHNMPSLNKTILCENIEDMQRLYDACNAGSALQLRWFTAAGMIQGYTEEEWAKLLSGNK